MFTKFSFNKETISESESGWLECLQDANNSIIWFSFSDDHLLVPAHFLMLSFNNQTANMLVHT